MRSPSKRVAAPPGIGAVSAKPERARKKPPGPRSSARCPMANWLVTALPHGELAGQRAAPEARDAPTSVSMVAGEQVHDRFLGTVTTRSGAAGTERPLALDEGGTETPALYPTSL